jgi:hypothetical protein
MVNGWGLQWDHVVALDTSVVQCNAREGGGGLNVHGSVGFVLFTDERLAAGDETTTKYL